MEENHLRLSRLLNESVGVSCLWIGRLCLADPNVGIRILAGCTTGALAVSVAQPTDVVKVRFQAQMNLQGLGRRYSGTMQAYRQIFQHEGLRGLWKGGLSVRFNHTLLNKVIP